MGTVFISTETEYMDEHSKIYVAGHRGLVGSALVRALDKAGYANLLIRSHADLDLTDQAAVRAFFAQERPEFVLLAAAKVGGIMVNNNNPANFVYDNLAIQTNVIDAAFRSHTKRLLFLGSSCIYPKCAPQPLKEEYLLSGSLEPTNRPYAIAKIAGIEMCWAYNRQYGTNFLAAMPTNLYGPSDDYDLSTSHVIPALLRRIVQAKTNHESLVSIWGSGTPRREFLHSDDLAAASLFLMNLSADHLEALLRSDSTPPLINVGWGEDLTIHELAALIAEMVGFEGDFVFDNTKPDGTPRKLLDVTRLKALGWQPQIDLRTGLQRTVKDMLEEMEEAPFVK
jgi:GDP-L-fucose synthase